jgi:hypothetical protein
MYLEIEFGGFKMTMPKFPFCSDGTSPAVLNYGPAKVSAPVDLLPEKILPDPG